VSQRTKNIDIRWHCVHGIRDDGKMEAQCDMRTIKLTMEQILSPKLLETFRTNIREGQLYVRCTWEQILEDVMRKSTLAVQRENVKKWVRELGE
jgi:hypothetical protein